MRSVLLDEFLLVGWDLIHDENRIGRAHWNTGATIDAAFRVDIQLGRRFEGLFILFGMDTVGRASFHAEFIFGTGIGNYVGHDCDLPFGIAATIATARRFFRQIQCTNSWTIQAVTSVTPLL